MIDPDAIRRHPRLARIEGRALAGWLALIGAAFVVVAAHGWARAADAIVAPVPTRIDLPVVPGWTRVDYAPSIWWEPRAQGADHRLLGRYRDASGREVDIFLALYASQGDGREAGGFGQGALMPQSPWAWQSAGPAVRQGRSERLLGNGTVERVAVTWYRSGGLLTGSNVRLKLAVIADHLLFRARPATLLILSAEDTRTRPAAASIDAFLRATGPLDGWMDRVGGVR
jgi:EpsI family protein